MTGAAKNWLMLFGLAFALNLIWENLHSFLYIHYKGNEITQFILIRAAGVDALIILALSAAARLNPFLKARFWIVAGSGLMAAIILERWAIKEGRWAYNGLMPVLPYLATGLTPTVQLGLLGALSYRLIFNKNV